MKTEKLIKSFIELKRLGDTLGISIKEVRVAGFYLDTLTEMFPDKLLGIKISNGYGDLEHNNPFMTPEQYKEHLNN